MYTRSTQNFLTNPIAKSQSRLLWLCVLLIIATILGALAFEHLGGYIPCKLCLGQREPYYVAIVFTLLALLSQHSKNYKWMTRSTLAIIACLMAYGVILGAFHAGVEWKLWQGPADCGAASSGNVETTTDLLNALKSSKAPSCDSATWRMFGLSFAGWNALISGFLTLSCLWMVFSKTNQQDA